jgi:adenylate cyclase
MGASDSITFDMARERTRLLGFGAERDPLGDVNDLRLAPKRARQRLTAAFRAEERNGLWTAAIVRSVLAAVLTLFMATLPGDLPSRLYSTGIGVVFVGLGVLQALVYRRRSFPGWVPFGFVACDVIFLGFVGAMPNPFHVPSLPLPIGLREATFVNLFIALLQVAFSFRPLLVLWAGFCSVAALAGVPTWMRRQPGVISDPGWWHPPAWQVLSPRYFDPMYVPLGKIQQEMLIMSAVAIGLAFLVWRSRRLVAARAVAERARGNLARYFSPKMIDALERRDVPMGQGRRQNIAVLFADIVGFTALAETVAPEEAMELLRAFHARMEAVVFAHGGCLERLAGDSLMASFGVPDPGPRDAADALGCARAMLVALDAWNAARAKAGYPAIAIGIGLHHGPAVLGDIGTERSMAFTVIGDTVNLASRLQAMTRDLGAVLCASDTLVVRARTDGAAPELLDGLVDRGAQLVRGREQPVHVFTLSAS